MKRRLISLFTGVGGLDFGFEAAGFETAVALDLDPVACCALRLNRRWPVLQGDLSAISSDEILATAGLRVGEADLLIGGPPCQPFSKSGYWASGDAKRLRDPRSNTLSEFFRVVRDTLPRAFMIENVLGIAYSGKSEGIDFVRAQIDEINEENGTRYVLSMQALNAANYGVPQVRERVFIVASRDGLPFQFPLPTHKPLGGGDSRDLEPYRTAWDALGGTSYADEALQMTGKWADLLPTIPEGQNYLWHTVRGGGSPLFGWRRRYWNFLLKLAKDQPSWTIQAQPGPATGPFHWENRKLAAEELARLQTFPRDLEYPGRRSDAQRLIGNAVPSALAETLARQIRIQFFGETDISPRPRLVPPRRLLAPPAERPVALPDKFLALIGDHEEHPGTGKGRRAARRLLDAA